MRSHRTPACALALALAVGVGALLVGLSVAPKVLPGDTFRVEPRSISSVFDGHDDPTDIHTQGFHAAHAGIASFNVFLAVMPIAGSLCPSGSPLDRLTRSATGLTSRDQAPAGCRGPPVH